jgi:hypothetical protein
MGVDWMVRSGRGYDWIRFKASEGGKPRTEIYGQVGGFKEVLGLEGAKLSSISKVGLKYQEYFVKATLPDDQKLRIKEIQEIREQIKPYIEDIKERVQAVLPSIAHGVDKDIVLSFSSGLFFRLRA